LLQQPEHAQLVQWIKDLNHIYKMQPALHQDDFTPAGFQWIDASDYQSSVISFLRKSSSNAKPVAIVCNFTPVPRANYRIGVPQPGFWRELLNSDASAYGGSGIGNLGGVESSPSLTHGFADSITLTLPPLGVLYLQHTERAAQS
jgi:1,4-alpha-glucan branching enzyme